MNSGQSGGEKTADGWLSVVHEWMKGCLVVRSVGDGCMKVQVLSWLPQQLLVMQIN